MQQKDRAQEAIDYLTNIVRHRGRQYALGMCMGILARLARVDYALLRELRDRSRDADNDSKK